uniref:Uncharacterized protein n=1 Tax=Arcella intermedia TaxID=1963864 RepID=A0A6B2LC57_9EUKA
MRYIFNHNTQPVTRIKFGKNSVSMLAFISEDLTISLFNMLAREELPQIFSGHKQRITDFDWSTTNDFIITSSIDKSLRYWDVKTQKTLRLLPSLYELYCCAFHPVNNTIVVAGTSNGFVEFKNCSTGKDISKVYVESVTRSIIFSEDGLYLFLACDDGKIRWLKCNNVGKFTQFKLAGSARVLAGKSITSIDCHYSTLRKNKVINLLLNMKDSTVRVYQFFPNHHDDKSLVLLVSCPVINKNYTLRASFCPTSKGRKKSNEIEEFFAVGSEDSIVRVFAYPLEVGQ